MNRARPFSWDIGEFLVPCLSIHPRFAPVSLSRWLVMKTLDTTFFRRYCSESNILKRRNRYYFSNTNLSGSYRRERLSRRETPSGLLAGVRLCVKGQMTKATNAVVPQSIAPHGGKPYHRNGIGLILTSDHQRATCHAAEQFTAWPAVLVTC